MEVRMERRGGASFVAMLPASSCGNPNPSCPASRHLSAFRPNSELSCDSRSSPRHTSTALCLIAAVSGSQTATRDDSVSAAHAVVLAARLIDMLPGIQRLCQQDAEQMTTCHSARARLSLATDECLRQLDDLPEVWSCNASSQSDSEAAAMSGSTAAASAEQAWATSDDAGGALLASSLKQWAGRVTAELLAWELEVEPVAGGASRSASSPAIMAHLCAVTPPAHSRVVRQDVVLIADRLASRRGGATFAPYAASVLGDLQDVLSEHLELRSQGAAHPEDLKHDWFGGQPAAPQPVKVSLILTAVARRHIIISSSRVCASVRQAE